MIIQSIKIWLANLRPNYIISNKLCFENHGNATESQHYGYEKINVEIFG